MTAYDAMLEDDEFFGEDDESDDEYYLEDDESDDEAAERRRRRPRGRRPPRIRVGKTGTGRNLAARPATGTKAPVTSASLQASLERVGRDIRANAAAIKNLAAQVKTATANLTSVNNKQDAAIADLRSDIKKQGGAYAQSSQLAMLAPLLTKSPELEIKAGANTEHANRVLADVQVKKIDNTLPLIIGMMGGMQPGAAGGSQMNMMLPMLLLLDR
jgi:hypothetical protein